MDLPFDLAGSVLIVGPSNVGKTRLTALALSEWVNRVGPDDVVVLDFAPEVEQDERVLGGHLDHFVDVPDGVWQGIVVARAPRTEGGSRAGILDLARQNADSAQSVFEAAPETPRAVFVNDATIPFQSGGDTARLTDYCEEADVAVLNAFESDELGTSDPVSQNERAALSALRSWVDLIIARCTVSK